MTKPRRAFVIGAVNEWMRFKDASGNEFAPVSLNALPAGRPRGNQPADDGIFGQLKSALYAEAWISLHVLQRLDVRALLPDANPQQARTADSRTAAMKRGDAYALVESVFEQADKRFPTLFNRENAFSIDSLLRWGREAVKDHYPAHSVQELRHFLTSGKSTFANAAQPGVTDADLGARELEKLRHLLTALAKCDETNAALPKLHRGPKRTRGRPSKRSRIIPLLDFTLKSRIDYPDRDGLHLIAMHSGINPTYLWSNLGDVHDLFAASVLIGRLARHQPLADEDIRIITEYFLPSQSPGVIAKTPSEQAIWHLLRSFMAPLEKVAATQ